MNKVTALLRYCLISAFLCLGSHSIFGQSIDLELSITVSPPTYQLYGSNIGIIVLSNKGNSTATNIEVKIPFPTGMVYSDHQLTSGNFEPFGGVWTISSLGVGQQVELDVTYFISRDVPGINLFGQVTNVDQIDIDSSPNNAFGNIAREDDEASVQMLPQGQTGGSNTATFTSFPKENQLFPRNRLTNFATINISGSVSTSTYEKVRLKIFRENTLNNSIDQNLVFSNGQAFFDFQFDLKAERKNYRIEAYAIVGRSEILLQSADNIVAGDVIIINGQSNAEARAAAWPDDYDEFLRSYTDNVGWNRLNRSFPGQWGARLAKSITTEQGIPVAVFNQAVGAQQIPFYLKNDAAPLSGNYGQLLQRLRDAGVDHNIMAAFWFHGEADGWTTSIADYKAHFTEIYNDWIQDYKVEHVYLYQIRFNSCSHPFPRIMEAHRQIGAELPFAETMSTMNSAHDGCHYDYFDGYEVLGNRMYGLVKRDFYNGPTNDVSSPNVVNIYKSGTKELTIEMSNATSGLQYQGDPWVDFKVEGSGINITRGRVSGNKIILELNGDPAGASGLSYLGHSGLTPSWIGLNNGVAILTFYNYPICLNCTGTPDPKADLSLSFNANKAELENGEPISFELTIQNDGPNDASNITANFGLPLNFTFLNSSTNYDLNSGTWVVGSINSGQSKSITINAVANILNPQEFLFAQITSSNQPDPDSSPNNDQNQIADEDDEGSLTILRKNTGGGSGGGGNSDEADLSLSMDVTPTQLQIYDFIYFTITVRNDGPANATNVEVSNPLPIQTVFTSASTSKGSFNPWMGNWQIGTLEPGEEVQLVLQLYVLDDTTPIKNFAQVIASDQNDPDSTPNNAFTIPSEDDEDGIMIDKNGSQQIGSGGGNGGGQQNGPDLEIELSAPLDEYQQYAISTFTLRASNTGTELMQDIIIRFDYPTDFVFTQASPERGSFEPWLQEWNLGNLAVGESINLEVQLYALAGSGPRTAFAEVVNANPSDIDSSPDNAIGQTVNEDDESSLTLANAADIRSATIQATLLSAKKTLHLTKLYPNPTADELYIQIESREDQIAELGLLDALGRRLKSFTFSLDKGRNINHINLIDLPAGVYYLDLPNTNRRGQRVRFIKITQ